MQRWDGSVQSSNTPTYDKVGILRDDTSMYRAMVVRVKYADDPKNVTKNSQNSEVLYDCIILGGFDAGQTLLNCRMSTLISGNNNFYERTLTATSKNLQKIPLSQHDGDVVYIEFNQGHDAFPVIIGFAKGISNSNAAKKSDGPREIKYFNGVKNEINSKGDYIFSVFGGTATNALGAFKPGTAAIYTETISAVNESFTQTFKSGLTLTKDGKNDKYVITTKGGASVDVDGKGDKVSIKTKAGVEASLDGAGDKVEIKTKGGPTISMDGGGKKISIKAGATEVTIDGNSGKIQLKGQMVDLGATVSDFVTMFTQLATAFNSHFHQLGPIPTTPPVAPLLVTAGSQTVKVQP